METEAQRNRRLMPETAAIRDEWKRVFGPTTVFRWAKEGGREIGKPVVVGRAMNADQWLHFLRTGVRPEEASC